MHKDELDAKTVDPVFHARDFARGPGSSKRVLHLGSASDNGDEGCKAHETKQPHNTYHEEFLGIGHLSPVKDYGT